MKTLEERRMKQIPLYQPTLSKNISPENKEYAGPKDCFNTSSNFKRFQY